MERIELHAKTKYGLDYDSVIDIEALLWNAKENGERGIVIADKDSILAFPKIEKIYNELCLRDSSFKEFKVGYGVQITSIVEEKTQEIILLVKNQTGLKNLYKIMSQYKTIFNEKMPLHDILKYKSGLLMGLILNNTNINLDLSLFDYIEINHDIDIANLAEYKPIVFSNNPNTFFPGDKISLEILYFNQKIPRQPKCRLYLNTSDTLKLCPNEEVVVTNTNLIFDKLESITINDGVFHITHLNNFDNFVSLVKSNLKKKYKNYSFKEERINRELKLIKELDYLYYFKILYDITHYCREHNEYYELDGYINNSLVAYVLDITTIEPSNLPCELFFSQTPEICIRVSPDFFHQKLFTFIKQNFKDKFLKCGYGSKLSNTIILGMINHYEKEIKKKFSLSEKDYICNLLNQVLLCQESLNTSYFIIPENMEIEDFTPYEIDDNDLIRRTHFDYSDLTDNLIKINFFLSEEIKIISHLKTQTKTKIEFCTEAKVYALFRDTEPFKTDFKTLDRTTGLLNISYFDSQDMARKLKRIPNLWFDDLLLILAKKDNLLITDDLYNSLNQRNLDDPAIFNMMNYLKEKNNGIISKATLMNRVRLSYMQMYYKLYYPKEYYREILASYKFEYVDKNLFSYDIEKLKKTYLELNKKDRLWMKIDEHQSLSLLEILLEMYERKIAFKFVKEKVFIK